MFSGTFDEAMLGLVYIHLHKFTTLLKEGIESGFPNGLGRDACTWFLHAAVLCCAGNVLREGLDLDITPVVYNIGGAGSINRQNVAVGVKKVSETALHALNGFEERDNALRKIQEWEYSDLWKYRHLVPDVVLEVDTPGGKVGTMTVEVKSYSAGLKQAQIVAFTQALKGLRYGAQTQSAGIVVHPKEVWFIDISVENGYIMTKKKQYLVCKDLAVTVDHEQYKELFKDVVLYMWNTYYKEYHSSSHS